jgi:predicted transcriptional regulator
MSQPAQKVHLGVLIREEQRRELAALARREDRSVSSVTRQAIDAYLASEHAQPDREGAAR